MKGTKTGNIKRDGIYINKEKEENTELGPELDQLL